MNDNDFDDLLGQAGHGHMQAVLEAVDQDRRLATRARHWDRRTLLHEACEGENVELARGLLARGALVGVRKFLNYDATWIASEYDNVDLMRLLLDHGGDPNTRNNDGWTALGHAGSYGHLAVCLLLLSRGADLMAIWDNDKNALEGYGYWTYPALSSEVLAEHRAALLAAWRAGPHPSQRWARRLPMMLFVTGCRFKPLAGKKGWIPPEGLSLEQRERSCLRILVFSSYFLFQLILSFL